MFGTRSALVWPRGLLSATQEPTGASGRTRANMPIWVNTRNGSYRLFSIRQDLLAPTASDDDRRRRLTPPHWQPRKKSALQICNSFYLVFILRLTIKTILFKKILMHTSAILVSTFGHRKLIISILHACSLYLQNFDWRLRSLFCTRTLTELTGPLARWLASRWNWARTDGWDNDVCLEKYAQGKSKPWSAVLL